jgi:hypothetical protein
MQIFLKWYLRIMYRLPFDEIELCFEDLYDRGRGFGRCPDECGWYRF